MAVTVKQGYLADEQDVFAIKLSGKVEVLQDNASLTDKAKLEKKYMNAKAKMPNAVGVIDVGIATVTLFNDGKYFGTIWKTKTKVSGSWAKL